MNVLFKLSQKLTFVLQNPAEFAKAIAVSPNVVSPRFSLAVAGGVRAVKAVVFVSYVNETIKTLR